jgi:hypothetical protein
MELPPGAAHFLKATELSDTKLGKNMQLKLDRFFFRKILYIHDSKLPKILNNQYLCKI